MHEGDAPGMQRLARKRLQRRRERRIVDLRPSRLAVLRVADDRPAVRRKMDANLVAPAGDETTAEKRETGMRRVDRRQTFELRDAATAGVAGAFRSLAVARDDHHPA